jgi:choline dehydrogenase-like flavoprotein
MHWARQSYRLSPMDFEANAKEGVAIPWPVTYDEIAPWYDKAEIFAGISGSVEGLPAIARWQVPASARSQLRRSRLQEDDRPEDGPQAHHRPLRQSHRAAHSQREPAARHLPGTQHVYPRLSFGGYFSSVSATLPSAERTGNMTLLADQIAVRNHLRREEGKATGVRVIDANTGKQTDYFAKIVFMCASALGSAYIMLNSTSSRFPNGFGNDSGELGCNIMDHNKPGGSSASVEGYLDVA